MTDSKPKPLIWRDLMGEYEAEKKERQERMADE